MAWKVFDYECPRCGAREERTVNGDGPQVCQAEVQDDIDTKRLLLCNAVMTRLVGAGAPPITIVKGNSDYKDRERERLETRATDHWNKHGKAEALERVRTKRAKDGL